jgi:hypothetical protein
VAGKSKSNKHPPGASALIHCFAIQSAPRAALTWTKAVLEWRMNVLLHRRQMVSPYASIRIPALADRPYGIPVKAHHKLDRSL